MKRLVICVVAAVLSFVIFATAPLKPHGEGMALHTTHDTVRELVILGLSIVAIVAAVSILIRGKPGARVIAVVTCLWPLRVIWVFGVFLFDQVSR